VAKVFINYRTSDEPNAAVLLKRELSSHFGEDNIFLDDTSIPPGSDFEQELLGAVRDSSLLLTVIGSRWLEASEGAWRRAVDNPADWVRREIAEAFTCGVVVVPILVDDASLLTSTVLPADIAQLTKRQFLRLRGKDIDYDLRRIVATVGEYLPVPRPHASGADQTKNSITMTARLRGHGRAYQAGRDQVING
jgi:hypothetical protein